MADTKVSALTNLSAPVLSDYSYAVLASGPTERRVTFDRLLGLLPLPPGGRLTLTTGVPVTTADVTGATNIYYTPHVSNLIILWDGTRWVATSFSETTLALGTITSALPYDVFGYANSGVLALESLAWTNATTRATGVSIQDGRYCKTGDKTRLYLGTFYTTSTTTTEDSESKRFLWNMYNRRERAMRVYESTNSWAYSTATVRQANGSTANQLDFVIGLSEDTVRAEIQVLVGSSGATAQFVNAGFGLDQVTALSAGLAASVSVTSAIYQPARASYNSTIAVGRHYLAWLEKGSGSDTQTWFGDNALVPQVGGMHGTVIG